MLTYTPKRRGNAHVIIPLILVIAAVVLGLSASMGITPKLPLQLLAVVFLTIAVWLINRFALTDFIYTLSDGEGSPPDSLIITCRRGKTLSREYIPQARITAVLSHGSSIPAEVKTRYNFCVSPVGASYCVVLFDDPQNETPSAALLECSPEFAARIAERITPINPSL